MREWNEIIGLMKQYRLLDFSDDFRHIHEGRYRFEHWAHDTGSHVRIYALLPGEELLVYRRDQWQHGYEHHLQGTVQGFQHEGPWREELEQFCREWDGELTAYLERVRRAKLKQAHDIEFSEADKLRRFTEAFED